MEILSTSMGTHSGKDEALTTLGNMDYIEAQARKSLPAVTRRIRSKTPYHCLDASIADDIMPMMPMYQSSICFTPDTCSIWMKVRTYLTIII